MNKMMKIMDGNEAAAYVAYRVTDLSCIYPITPSTTMGELADQWSAAGVKNMWGVVPQVAQMQSEAGAAGGLHGALQTGAVATTYTASQGLLLMIPNMYKIAGELTAAVIHVAARSLACQGLSIFGDHSDVMSVRDTGFALLSSGSVQEAHDLALVAHAATLEARVPFVHFFDGFRTSHEINKIELLGDDVLRSMIDEDLVLAHRARGLNPEHPVLRGTAQNPDVYFQGREAVNPYYAKVPVIVQSKMDQLAELTGRRYHTLEYYGDPQAERIVVVMGSAAKTVEQMVDYLRAQGEAVGAIQVHLYRPLDIERLLAILPEQVCSIAVLDRTKEPGSLGEPLYLDINTALLEAYQNGRLNRLPKVVGGRYGLSSKEFTPAMAKAVFDNLQQSEIKNHFTVGISDDVSNSSLNYDPQVVIKYPEQQSAIFYGLGSDGTVGANKNTIKIIGNETPMYVQGYFVYDSKKSGSKTTSHLRFSPQPINSPYLLSQADFVGCHQFNFVFSDGMLDNIAEGGVFLLNSPYGIEEVWQQLPRVVIEKILRKKVRFYIIDAYKVAEATGMGSRINTIMQTCFFAISGVLPPEDAIAKIKEAIVKTYQRKGDEVVKQNFAAVDQTLAHLVAVPLIEQVPAGAKELVDGISSDAPKFVKEVIAVMLREHGESLPVSVLPADGTYPTGTTKWEKRNVSQHISIWNADKCIQCGLCSMICPHGVLRAKHFTGDELRQAPEHFKTAACKLKEFNGEQFHLQSYLEDCTGCGLCKQVCPMQNKEDPAASAIHIGDKADILQQERENIAFFEQQQYTDRTELAGNNPRELQYLQPYFEFSSACAGCGETPYIKLVSQLFGDHMVVANATGCSSIYGGNLPTTPWCVDDRGRGPAWANSLFEDNAEFGYGFRLSLDRQCSMAVELLQQLRGELPVELYDGLLAGVQQRGDREIAEQRERIEQLKKCLASSNSAAAAHLGQLADHLAYRSVWIIGGDGWAYDIGYGGLDHVLASGRNVNVLVLDTEVYSNTGGQASKSTPRAAVAKFAASGKGLRRKDLGMMAISYGNVYVAQVSIGANPNQLIKALKEAESYDGPSLIIAYSHCIAHGYNLSQGVTQQKLAVDSGFWPLYRYNPILGDKALQLDSKTPTVPLRDYVYNEQRFKALVKEDAQRAEQLLAELEEDIKARWVSWTKLAGLV